MDHHKWNSFGSINKGNIWRKEVIYSAEIKSTKNETLILLWTTFFSMKEDKSFLIKGWRQKHLFFIWFHFRMLQFYPHWKIVTSKVKENLSNLWHRLQTKFWLKVRFISTVKFLYSSFNNFLRKRCFRSIGYFRSQF